MEAPERLYCMHRLSGDYSCSTTPFAGGDEYTRTDAFIEKAKKWLYLQLNEINMEDEDMENFLKDFKKYMED